MTGTALMVLTLDDAYPLWLALLSLATFLAFGWDKFCAAHRRPRIPERTLLLLILLGGLLGGWLGQLCFRHKSRKSLFRVVLLIAAALHGALLWLRFRGAGI